MKQHRIQKDMLCLSESRYLPVYSWQQNHEVLMSLYKDMETGRYVPNSVSSSWTDRKKEEKELIDELLAHFSKSNLPISRKKARYTDCCWQNIFI